MKNPNTARGAGAFRVTLDATVSTSSNATVCPSLATQIERRFRWCTLSNSVQPLKLNKGVLAHD